MAPPPARGQWDLRYHSSETVSGWEELGNQAPGPTYEAWVAMATGPRDRSNPRRQHQLRGELATREVGGKVLEQWLYEVTGAGRVWYCIDDETKTVWVTKASCGHPSETER